eukprot:5506173-Alexandrium_andersonii.AAC.1
MDRPDLGFSAKECCRRMSAPTSTDWAPVVRLARYLIRRPRRVQNFPRQNEGAGIRAYVGTDFAGRLRTRRSTCGGVCMRGQHTITR